MATKSSKKSAASRNSASKKKAASKKSLPAKKKIAASKKSAPLTRTTGKFVITTRDIIKVLDLNIRTAQRLLQKTRTTLDKEKSDYVTVKEFCEVNKFDEGEFRARMAE
jgi:hypothetical protein